MGIRVPAVSSFPSRPLSDEERAIRRLSDRLLAAVRPIRILEAVNWPAPIERAFFASGGRELPPVCRELYAPLPFDPTAKLLELTAIERDVRAQLGRQEPATRLLRKAAGEYRLAVRLLAARGMPAFASLSRDLYGTTQGAAWVGEFSLFLTTHLEHVLETEGLGDAARLTASEAIADLAARLAVYFGPDALIRVLSAGHLAADACAAGDALKIRSGARFAPADVRMLEVHEGWVHLGTTLNGKAQPVLTLLARGTPSATRTQEGLAVFLEFLTGAAHPQRIRKHLLRLRGLAMAEAGADFRDVYRHFLSAADRPADAYQQTMRIFRGSLPTGGAFTKDLSYARGLLDVFRFARAETTAGLCDPFDLLFCGKASLEDVGPLAELSRRGMLALPRHVPAAIRDRQSLAHYLATMPALRPLAAVA